MLDLDALRNAQDLAAQISAQLENLLSCGVITQAEYAAVPARRIVRFFASSLGQRLLASDRVEREWAFTFRRTDGRGQAQLVQGVIDCCFMERGQWILIDYKTDSAQDIAAVLEKHRPQVKIYAEALERITGIKVRERMLYLVRAGSGYAV